MSEAIAALIGALVGFVASFLTLRFNYKQLFAETVSSNRMEWINVWRENISKFLACAETINEFKLNCKCKNQGKSCCTCTHNNGCDKKVEYFKEMYQARSMIVSRLNLTEEKHQIMLATINNFKCNVSENEFVAQREFLLEVARQILKPEWERMKNEARGKGE